MSINGYEYDFSTVRLSINAVNYADIQDIKYSEKQERQPLYGSGPEIIGFTRGQYSADGSFTLTRKGFEKLIAQIPEMMDYEFVISVVYQNPGEMIINETITGVRITSIDRDNAVGNDATKVALNFVAKKVSHNDGNVVASDAILGQLISAGTSIASIASTLKKL